MVIGYTKFRSHIITIETTNYRPVTCFVYDYNTCRYFYRKFYHVNGIQF